MFARGDRVFPVDDLGGGVWSRRGTVLSVHPPSLAPAPAATGGVRVDATPAATSSCARATVLWDDGSAEVLAEDKLCLVYDQEAPIGIRVVTMAMSQPCDVVDHGGQVVLVLREGLLGPEALTALRTGLGRVRAALTPGSPDAASAAELRRRDLNLLNALIAELTGPLGGQPEPAAPSRAVAPGPPAGSARPAPQPDLPRPDVVVGAPAAGADARGPGRAGPAVRPDVVVGRPDVAPGAGRGQLPGAHPQGWPRP
ncbi:hypothetical protein UG55_102469 [Frankia sp. EI5c]|nr:hypothetical protein UG55_102469 [Frankia sp. EI5c]